jgi:hypothetical protein
MVPIDPDKGAPMVVKQKHVRKVLTKKMFQLNDIMADIDQLLTEMETDFYRVCIFGSARIKEGSDFYIQVEELADGLARQGVDIVTGGGPGLMEAANKGAKRGSQGARSIGLPIELPFEADANGHMDVKSHHKRFSSRLDEFMRISHAVVVMPGGIGTVLELFFTWQLLQVDHIKRRPVILLGPPGFWDSLMEWMTEWPLRLNLMSKSDMSDLMVVSSVEEVLKILHPEIETFIASSPKMQKAIGRAKDESSLNKDDRES